MSLTGEEEIAKYTQTLHLFSIAGLQPKDTSPVDYDMRLGENGICPRYPLQELTKARKHLTGMTEMKMIKTYTLEEVKEAANSYFSLLLGTMMGKYGELMTAVQYNWTNVIGNVSTHKVADAQFEFASMCIRLSQWMIHYGIHLIPETIENLDEAENILKGPYRCFLDAHSLVQFVQDKVIGELESRGVELSTDLQANALKMFQMYSLGCAQEITVMRAIQKGNSTGLIARLCSDTGNAFGSAYECTKEWDYPHMVGGRVGKVRSYFIYKQSFYEILTYLFAGKKFYEDTAYGKAIVCLRHASYHTKTCASNLEAFNSLEPKTLQQKKMKEFSKHPALTYLSEQVEEMLSSYVRENNYIYQEIVPKELPKRPDGLSLIKGNLEEFQMPEMSPAWNGEQIESPETKNVDQEFDGVVISEEETGYPGLGSSSSSSSSNAQKEQDKDCVIQ